MTPPPRDPPQTLFVAVRRDLPTVRQIIVTKHCALRGFILVSTNGSIFVSVEGWPTLRLLAV